MSGSDEFLRESQPATVWCMAYCAGGPFFPPAFVPINCHLWRRLNTYLLALFMTGRYSYAAALVRGSDFIRWSGGIDCSPWMWRKLNARCVFGPSRRIKNVLTLDTVAFGPCRLINARSVSQRVGKMQLVMVCNDSLSIDWFWLVFHATIGNRFVYD